jgi:hypothetical protein
MRARAEFIDFAEDWADAIATVKELEAENALFREALEGCVEQMTFAWKTKLQLGEGDEWPTLIRAREVLHPPVKGGGQVPP